MNLRKDKKTIHMAIALDESGSMAGTKKQTISGVNEQLQELKKTSAVDSTVTLVTFSGPTDIKVIYSAKPISEVKELTEDDYNPNGGTAMYDGVGRLFNELQQKVVDDENTSYLVLVVSDGEENTSAEYDSPKIAQMVKDRLATKRWSINYIGANQDLSVVTQTLGLSKGSSFAYASNVRGTEAMWNNTRNCTKVYMASAATATTPDQLATLNANYFAGSTSADTKVN